MADPAAGAARTSGGDLTEHRESPDRTTGRSIALTSLSTLLPGVGLLGTRWRWLGLACTALVIAGLVAGGIASAQPHELLAWVGSPRRLRLISTLLLGVGLVWVCLIIGTHLLTRPTGSRAARIITTVTTLVLCLAVALPLAVAARYARVTATAISSVAKSQKDTSSGTRPTIDTDQGAEDIWKSKTRLNLLLVGLDDRADRNYQAQGTVSTDTMMVASIDTQTGDLVLIQVPRNMARTPFPAGTKLAKAYPNGYYDGNADSPGSWASGIWATVPTDHPELFADTDFPGADALKLGLQGALGLKLDYFVALDIDGLSQLIDAMGGVRINVSQDAPIGGNTDQNIPPFGWIKAGPNQQLDGYHAMWYARGRWKVDDFTRMSKQSCVIKAIVDQADPATLLTKFEPMVKASSQMFHTDIPQELVPAILELALRVKGGSLTRVMFIHGKDGFNTTDPDFAMMQARVRAAVAAAGGGAGKGSASASPTTARPTSLPGPEASDSAIPSATSGTASDDTSATPSVAPEDLTDACAYRP